MNKIKFNNVEVTLEGYNRTTYFSDGSISSNGSCNIITDDMTELNELAQDTITSIQIYSNDTLIYDLQDIDAKINTISEYLNGDRISISISLVFNMNESETEPESEPNI